jgi:serine/threonine protein kinase
LPPETISGQGYGFESDFWVLGILIYKLTIGEYPYGEQIKFEDPNALHMLFD